MRESSTDRALALVRAAGVLRARDLAAHGIPRHALRRLMDRGLIEQVSRGLYIDPEGDYTEKHSLAEVFKRAPDAVVCLLSALTFHNIGTQNPFEVWLAIEGTVWRPRIDYPPLRVMRFSGEAFTAGIEKHEVEGVAVRVYGPAKTVADCFKYRNKIGLDVGLEALKETWRYRRVTMDELWHFATIDRVANVMRPYLEMLVA